MSHSWEPGFSEDELRETVDCSVERARMEDRKAIDSLEVGLAQADETIEKLEAALADLTIDNCKANELLCRCQGYLARFPVSVWDENLPREIDIYIETLRKKLEGPQGSGPQKAK